MKVTVTISGDGFTPGMGGATTTYTGTIVGTQITGTFTGTGVGNWDKALGWATWQGTFEATITP